MSWTQNTKKRQKQDFIFSGHKSLILGVQKFDKNIFLLIFKEKSIRENVIKIPDSHTGELFLKCTTDIFWEHYIVHGNPNVTCTEENGCETRLEFDSKIHAVKCCSDYIINGWNRKYCQGSWLWYASDVWGVNDNCNFFIWGLLTISFHTICFYLFFGCKENTHCSTYNTY